MKEVFNSYIRGQIKLNKKEFITIFSLIAIFSGIFGWLYEFIFYFFNDGRFTFQGGNFFTWINIYAIGSLLIILTTYKIKKYPFYVFIVSMFSTGLLEYVSGLLIYKLGNGARYWDYNTEILNFGNINGFICFRSVLFFGLSALLLMYFILPFIIYITKKLNKRKLLITSIIILSIILFDEFYNLIISKILDLPSANEIYKSIGIK